MTRERDTLWDCLKEMSKETKQKRIQRNSEKLPAFFKALDEKEIVYTDNGQIIMFREPHKPKVDFYRTKGNWRLPTTGRVMYGGWKKFLTWYEKQT